MANAFEKAPERIPTQEEILEVIGRFAENYSVELVKADEHGPYLIDAIVEDPNTGEITEYKYQRKGGFRADGKNNGSLETAIDAYFYADREGCKNGDAMGAKAISVFDSETGEWKDAK
jgi:hypothetical protein